jgi:sugar phosphate isomerase/epimerase
MPLSHSRRSFLRFAALSPLTASALEPIRRVGGASFQPGLNAYSFLEQLQANAQAPKTGIDLFGVCEFAAKQNIAAVDLTGYFFPGYPAAPADNYVNRIKKHTHDLGLDISGTGVRNDFATADKAARAEGVRVTKEWIEVAARLGAPTIRVFAGPQPPHKDWQAAAPGAARADIEAWMADALRECAVHGEKFGVLVAVQNHGDFLNTGTEHVSLLRRVDHPWCGALVDTGKYLTDDPYADIATVAPYAVNWQIKETIGSSMKTPRTDFKKLAQIIHDSGYRGYVPIETLSMRRKDYDPAAEVIRVLAELRAGIAAII